MSVSETQRNELAAIVGEAHVTSDTVAPGTQEEVAAVLALAGREKLRWGPDFRISLARLDRILQYNAPDLTISVEAGITLAALGAALRARGQWLPLGAPRPERTTVGAALAGNLSGPFRLFYGTARDMVIGIRFATTDGKLLKSGGMVVKNVAGYDLAKLLIGSRGTLAVITQANFKTFPRPAASETCAMGFVNLAAGLEARTAIQKSALTPLAMDLMDAAAARVVSPQELPPGDWVLAVAYGGAPKVIERCRRDLQEIGRRAGMRASATLSGHDEERVWSAVSDLPAHMEEHAPGALRLKITSPISQLGAAIAAVPGDAVVARAGSGVTYVYALASEPGAFVEQARRALAPLAAHAVVEYSPAPVDRWGPPGDNFPVMQKLKQAFDPHGVLNPGAFLGGI